VISFASNTGPCPLLTARQHTAIQGTQTATMTIASLRSAPAQKRPLKYAQSYGPSAGHLTDRAHSYS
jgi:hypothetical protein